MMYSVYRENDALHGFQGKLTPEELREMLGEEGVKALRAFVLSNGTDAYKGVSFGVCEMTGAHGYCEEKECKDCPGIFTLWVKRHRGF